MALRFGITTMQAGRLLGAAAGAGVAPDVAARFDQAALVGELADLGFDPIELGGDLALFFPDAFASAAVDRLAAAKQAHGIRYTVHLPLWSVEPSTPLEPVRQGSIRALRGAIEATRPLAPEVYVVHATGALAAEFARRELPPEARRLVLGRFQERARASMEQLVAEAGLPSRRFAIETVEWPFELTLELAEQLDLSVCLDTGQVLAGFSGRIDLFAALERCLPRLGEIHLHDAPRQGAARRPRSGEDHRPLGAGDLDVPRLLDRLMGVGFAGPIVFELEVEDALASLEAIRAVRPEALAANTRGTPPR